MKHAPATKLDQQRRPPLRLPRSKVWALMWTMVLASTAGLLASTAGCVVRVDEPVLTGQDVRLTIVHTADVHSRLFPYQFAPGAIDKGLGLTPTHGDIAVVGGISRMASVIRCIRGDSVACGLTQAGTGGGTIGDLVGGSAARTLHLDSGDIFEGAPVFNTFAGEVEMRSMTRLGLNAMALGNHEFDKGAVNLELMKNRYGGFPILAANYQFSDPSDPTQPKLRLIIAPFAIFNVQGLRVGVIGMGNLSSLQGIIEGGNSLGTQPIEATSAVRNAVNIIRGSVDLVVMISHLGLDEDEGVAQTTNVMDQNPVIDGVDVVLGGHLHIVLNPPKDLPRTDDQGNPTGHTVLCHSGAFAKYVGRLDLAVHIADPTKNIVECSPDNVTIADCTDTCACKDAQGGVTTDISCPSYQGCVTQKMGPKVRTDHNSVKSYTYKLIPIDDSIPEDADMANMLEPYQLKMNQVLNLTHNYAIVPCSVSDSTCTKVVRADPDGADSQLGNMVAASMRLRPRVEADFGLTNSLGIRADFESGLLNLEEMYNVFPFDNTITTMFLSGNEIQSMMDFVAARSSERGCKTQSQVSGLWTLLDCRNKVACGPYDQSGARAVGCHHNPDGSYPADYQGPHDGPFLLRDDCINHPEKCQPVLPAGEYRVAVNDYIAAGGSGFAVLKRNTTKFNTGISLRDALVDFMVEQPNRCDPLDDNGMLQYTNIAGVTCSQFDPNGTVIATTDCTATCCHDVPGGPSCSAASTAFKMCVSQGRAPVISYDYSSLPCLDKTVQAHDGRISTVRN